MDLIKKNKRYLEVVNSSPLCFQILRDLHLANCKILIFSGFRGIQKIAFLNF